MGTLVIELLTTTDFVSYVVNFSYSRTILMVDTSRLRTKQAYLDASIFRVLFHPQ